MRLAASILHATFGKDVFDTPYMFIKKVEEVQAQRILSLCWVTIIFDRGRINWILTPPPSPSKQLPHIHVHYHNTSRIHTLQN